MSTSIDLDISADGEGQYRSLKGLGWGGPFPGQPPAPAGVWIQRRWGRSQRPETAPPGYDRSGPVEGGSGPPMFSLGGGSPRRRLEVPLQGHVLLEGDLPAAPDRAGLLERLDMVGPGQQFDRPGGTGGPGRFLGPGRRDGEGDRWSRGGRRRRRWGDGVRLEMGPQPAVLRLGDLAVGPQEFDEFGLTGAVGEEEFGELPVGPGGLAGAVGLADERVELRLQRPERLGEFVGRGAAAVLVGGNADGQADHGAGAPRPFCRQLDRSIGGLHAVRERSRGKTYTRSTVPRRVRNSNPR